MFNEIPRVIVEGYNRQQQQALKDRNYDGYFESPEYAQFSKLLPEFAYAMDREPYESNYFGTMTQGRFYGVSIDYSFKLFERRIKGLPMYENPYNNPETQTGFTETQTGVTETQTGVTETQTGVTGSQASGVPWLLLAAAAAYFLT